MVDPIDRRAAIDVMHKVILDLFDFDDDDFEAPMTYTEEKYLSINKTIATRLKALPSVQPKRKKGLWVVNTETDIKSGTIAIFGYKCNICGYFVPWDFTHKSPFYIEEYKFCPSCGAKMG